MAYGVFIPLSSSLRGPRLPKYKVLDLSPLVISSSITVLTSLAIFWNNFTYLCFCLFIFGSPAPECRLYNTEALTSTVSFYAIFLVPKMLNYAGIRSPEARQSKHFVQFKENLSKNEARGVAFVKQLFYTRNFVSFVESALWKEQS